MMTPHNRPSRECKRVDVAPDIDIYIYSSADEDQPSIVGLPSHRANRPISYVSIHASCHRWRDKVTAMKEELEDMKKEHENNVK
jgi:hypothetical protein